LATARFTFLEILFAILVGAGGLTALAGDKLGADKVKNAGLLVVFLGFIVIGLNMVVQRRADIATRYSSTTSPAFHVFRGIGGIAWGVVFIVAGLLLLGFGYASIAYGTGAQEYLTQHSNILLILGGLLIAAVGAGSATKATYRHGETERTDRRLIDRIAAIVFILPIGVGLLGWGLLKTFAPSVADRTASTLKAAAVQLFESLIN
jgi:hypothetical protein